MLTSHATYPNCQAILQELAAEAEKLNLKLHRLWQEAGVEPQPWCDPESYSTSYLRALAAMEQKISSRRQHDTAVLTRFADWLAKQKVNALGGLELFAVTLAEAAKEIRRIRFSA